MYLTFVLIFALTVLTIDAYFYRAVHYAFRNKKRSTRKLVKYAYWILSVATLLFMGVAAFYYLNKTPAPRFARTYLMGFVFILTVSKLLAITFLILYDVFRSILFLINKTLYRKVEPSRSKHAISRAEFLKKAAFVTAAIPFGTLMYGVLKSAFDYTIHRQKLTIPNLPETFKGLRIVQISDIHSGSFISNQPLQDAVDLIRKEQPDIVFFTGDLVNDVAEEALPFIDTLKQINPPLGVFSILGNHDYGDYFYRPDDLTGKAHNYELMKNIHQQLGWNLLLNANHVIEKDGDRLAILGVENWGSQGRFQKFGDVDLAKKGCLDTDIKLLLSHDPSHWEAKVLPGHPDIAATFSGHTHGMQFGIEIPGFKWSPSQYMYNQWAGLYQKDRQQIYVNRGLGFIGYPGRVGILPEITVFELV
ncbi:MAG: metallophosphoesterase [Flavobacteriales bacterium]|nr:metallophosphoesterase [Flavobacteriales bacterium]